MASPSLQQRQAQGSHLPSPQKARQIFQSALRYAQGNSRPALAISPDSRGGIIINKGYYSDFIGPGAALVNRHDLQGNQVVPVGKLKFRPLQTPEERQAALHRRVDYLRSLEEIARSPVALRRSCQIVEQLCEWITESEAQNVSNTLVASLVGVTPMAVQLAWRSHRESLSDDAFETLDRELLESDEHIRARALMQARLPAL